jgi:hypothetical protein
MFLVKQVPVEQMIKAMEMAGVSDERMARVATNVAEVSMTARAIGGDAKSLTLTERPDGTKETRVEFFAGKKTISIKRQGYVPKNKTTVQQVNDDDWECELNGVCKFGSGCRHDDRKGHLHASFRMKSWDEDKRPLSVAYTWTDEVGCVFGKVPAWAPSQKDLEKLILSKKAEQEAQDDEQEEAQDDGQEAQDEVPDLE